MFRHHQTLNHPHGYLQPSSDKLIGIVRISKNASTELASIFECKEWIPFEKFKQPTVAFLRNPYTRFISSIPETMHRLRDSGNLEMIRKDSVFATREIYNEITNIAKLPVNSFISEYIEIVKFAFFDCHHEPQISFLLNRHGLIVIDPFLYTVEKFDFGIYDIGNRFPVSMRNINSKRRNASGEKPIMARSFPIELFRKISASGVYERVMSEGPIFERYGISRSDKKFRVRDMNQLCNRFSKEIRETTISEKNKKSIASLYQDDFQLWNEVTSSSEVKRLSLYI